MQIERIVKGASMRWFIRGGQKQSSGETVISHSDEAKHDSSHPPFTAEQMFYLTHIPHDRAPSDARANFEGVLDLFHKACINPNPATYEAYEEKGANEFRGLFQSARGNVEIQFQPPIFWDSNRAEVGSDGAVSTLPTFIMNERTEQGDQAFCEFLQHCHKRGLEYNTQLIT